jgi:hypothetical protein
MEHESGAVRISMSANVLVDTNILVYAYDRSESVKQQHASDFQIAGW